MLMMSEGEECLALRKYMDAEQNMCSATLEIRTEIDDRN